MPQIPNWGCPAAGLGAGKETLGTGMGGPPRAGFGHPRNGMGFPGLGWVPSGFEETGVSNGQSFFCAPEGKMMILLFSPQFSFFSCSVLELCFFLLGFLPCPSHSALLLLRTQTPLGDGGVKGATYRKKKKNHFLEHLGLIPKGI